jgi:SAM-dependent methyltransferase
MLDKNSLERIIPDYLDDKDITGKETFKLHIDRYTFACKHTHGTVLDMACGVGYGSFFIADTCDKVESVTGVDISIDAIEYAKKRYNHQKIQFFNSDAKTFDNGNKYDSIVSLETIEHILEPCKLISNFSNLLKPEGKIVASVPITPSVDVNPHHISDFTKKSFFKLFNNFGFEPIDYKIQIQQFNPFSVLSGSEKRASQIRKGLTFYYLKKPNAFIKRVRSTLLDGFKNKYITAVFIKRKEF